jgi:hypothetical protein
MLKSETTFEDLKAAPILSDRITTGIVWGVGLVMILVDFVCIALYGWNIPLAEDWLLVAPLTGNEPDLLQWLWAQNNEHRIPLPRLIMLGLLNLTNGDFRAGMVFNVVIMGLLTFAMIQTARSLRGGRTSLADAFFPLILLNLGHWENLIWSWQLSFVIAIVLYCGIFLVLVRSQNVSAPIVSFYIGSSLVLLSLSGAIGLAFVPLQVLWLSYYNLFPWRTAESRGKQLRTRALVLVPAVLALALFGLYFVGYERPYWNPPSPGMGATLATAAKFTAMGFGPAAKSSWPLFILVALFFLLPAAYCVGMALFQQKGFERRRAFAILLFCCNLTLLALAMGWGRAGLMPTVGLPNRYALLATPFYCASFLISELYGSQGLRKVVQYGLVILALLVFQLNNLGGFQFRDWYVQGMSMVEVDLERGVSGPILAQRHRDFLIHWWSEEQLLDRMHMLRDAKIGPFEQMEHETTDIK